MKQQKRVVLCILLVGLLLLCYGCGKEEKEICKVGEETFYEKDMKAYGIMFASEHGLYSGNDFESDYEDGITYGEYYKDMFRKDVVETLLIYCKAVEEETELDKDEKKELKKKVEDLIDSYGTRWLNNNKLNKDVIERVCKIRMISNKYLEQEIVKNGGKAADAENDRYVRLYQVQFMTVKMKDNGLVETSEDGQPKEFTASEMARVKREADDFAYRAQEEDSITIPRRDYNSYMSQTDNYYKYDDLDEKMKEAIDNMEEGGISDVVRFQYGYCVFQLLEADAKEFSKNLFDYEYSEQERNFKESWIKDLRLEMSKKGNVTEDAQFWNQVKMSDYVR